MSADNHEDSSRSRWWQKPGVLPLARVFVVLVCLSLLATDGWLMWKARQVQLRDAEIETSNLAAARPKYRYFWFL